MSVHGDDQGLRWHERNRRKKQSLQRPGEPLDGTGDARRKSAPYRWLQRLGVHDTRHEHERRDLTAAVLHHHPILFRCAVRTTNAMPSASSLARRRAAETNEGANGGNRRNFRERHLWRVIDERAARRGRVRRGMKSLRDLFANASIARVPLPRLPVTGRALPRGDEEGGAPRWPGRSSGACCRPIFWKSRREMAAPYRTAAEGTLVGDDGGTG